VAIAADRNQELFVVVGFLGTKDLNVAHRSLRARHLSDHATVEAPVQLDQVTFLAHHIQDVLVDFALQHMGQLHLFFGDLSVGDNFV